MGLNTLLAAVSDFAPCSQSTGIGPVRAQGIGRNLQRVSREGRLVGGIRRGRTDGVARRGSPARAAPEERPGCTETVNLSRQGADDQAVGFDLGHAIRGEGEGGRARRLPLAIGAACAWAVLAAVLGYLISTDSHAGPAVVAVAAVLLAGLGAAILVALIAGRRGADRHVLAQLRQASALLRAIEAVTEPGLAFLDLDTLLPTVLERARGALRADLAAVLLADPEGSTLRVRAASGATDLAPVGSEIQIDEGVLGAAASWARPVVVDDVEAAGVGPLPDWQPGIASLMAAPLIVLGTVIGTVEVASCSQRRFGPADRRLLQVVADRLAAAVERARLDEVATRSRYGAAHAHTQLRLLARGGTALAKALEDYDDAMHELAEVVVPDFADWFGVHVLEETGQVRQVITRAAPKATGSVELWGAEHPHPRGEELAREAMGQRRAQVLLPTSRLGTDALGAVVHTHHTLGECPCVTSMLVVPIRVRGAFMACLSFVTMPGRRGYRPSDLETARELAERVGVAIERVHSWRAAKRAGEVASDYAERLRRLVDVSLVMNAQFSEDEVLQLLAEHTQRALEAEVTVVSALACGGAFAEKVWPPQRAGDVDGDEELRDVVLAASHVALRQGGGSDTVPATGGGVSVAASSSLTSAMALPAASRGRGWIVAPINDTTGEVRRVVVAVGERGARFSLEDESVLTVLAQMASVALRNARLYGEVLGNEQRLQTVVDCSPVAIAELGATGEAHWWNRAAATLFGWPDSSGPRRIPVRADSELVLGGLLDSAFAGKPVVGVVMSVTGADGEPLELSVSVSPIGSPGEVTGALVVAEDVTGRRRMLEQVHQAERLQAMSRMAGALAHDFNNLLTVILGCGESLMRRLGQDEELGPDVAAIHRAGTRAAALTSQLVRIGGQRHPVQAEVVRVDDAIAAMKPMLAGVLGEHVHLRISTGAAKAKVLVDPSELERAVLNLVINARDAMPGGGTCTLETRRVAPAQSSGAGVVELSVADDGVGMDGDTAAHCFEPFFTTKGRARGTGLGLSAVHAIVAQAGGDVAVASSPGAGTTFTIRLPVVEGSPAAVAPAPEPELEPELGRGGGPVPERSGDRATLLVVDDEPEVLRLEVRELEAAGYEVLAARNALEALHILDAHGGGIDLLVTDVVMPGMSGIELAAALRARDPGVGVLFMSGHLDDDTTARASLPDHATLLVKPFGPDELSQMVRASLRRVHADRARGVRGRFAIARGATHHGSKR